MDLVLFDCEIVCMLLLFRSEGEEQHNSGGNQAEDGCIGIGADVAKAAYEAKHRQCDIPRTQRRGFGFLGSSFSHSNIPFQFVSFTNSAGAAGEIRAIGSPPLWQRKKLYTAV